ncbi:MAG: RdgB/HAM1 family non-canonical purine NTP pyrophosphatase [Actinobacteria bacterium]|nr:RdgB/HAM1 family non-canonical purine NTP pyrophosphatase [Actinomycetota bacterium]
MIEIIIASKNEGKIKEIKNILNLPNINFLTYKDFEKWPEVDENGNSFEENALIKAKALVEAFNKAALADDSGLEVDVLGGLPGIKSARYAGEEGLAEKNNAKLLKELSSYSFDERTARFKCCIVFTDSKNRVIVSEGVCEGHIALEMAGSGGFGYDPLFIPLGHNKTFAEIPLLKKNAISHRGIALLKMKNLLKDYI